VNNTVTINNCIDFEDGTLSVYYHYENGVPNSVYVDFDGSLYTSIERTSIWKGKAALTEIKNGSEYGLVPYNNGGNKMSGFNENTITLIWPNAYGLGQTLAGMVFKMTYGSLGIMYDTTDTSIVQLTDSTSVLGYVLSFSAALDLGFLIPKSKKAKEEDEKNSLDAGTELYWLAKDPEGELRSLWNHYFEQTKKKETQTGKEYTKGKASVLVDDVLFGCGKGFMGVNFTVDVALPAYVDSMPSLTGKLMINTINNWSFGVKGKCQFTKIILEAELLVKSYKNIPIPDKLYFYVEGFEPGINIDGFGVIWITGGGGGFDKLYDTIFASNGIPPLKLMLSVAFDVFKVLSARADLSLSLRGIGLNVEGVKVKGIDIEIIKKMQLTFDWYPDIYFMAAVSATYYAILEGQGYIVIIDNEKYKGFFEGFLRGKIKIPSAIPIIGGLELAGIDLGLNNQKIWGSATALGAVNFSVVYYWGADIDISLKKNENAQPTFPELLSQGGIPVYYDAETDRTMYMSIGNNITVAAMPEITDNIANTPRLMASMPQVYSDSAKERHIVNAGSYSGVKYAYTITFDAQSLEEARTIAAGFSITDDSGDPFDLDYYSVSANNLNTANANVTFDEEAGKGTLGIVLSKSDHYDKNWNIDTTGVPADIVLFEMGELPKVTTISHTLTGNGIDVSWDGTQLDMLDSLSFYLTKEPEGNESGELIASFTESNDLASKNKTLTIPGSLASGNYYLRAVYSQENAVNGVIISDIPISYTNNNQPSDPSGVIITNAGDLSFNVNIEGDTNADGYLVSVYEIVAGNLVETDITHMAFDKEEGVLPQILVGGSYQGFDMDNNPKTYGLLAGKNYRVGVKSYKYVDEDDDGLTEYVIYGNEVLSNVENLKAVTPPDIRITEKTPFKLIDEKQWGLDQNGNPAEINVDVETFNVPDVEYLVESPDIDISGSWYVDDFDYSGDFTETKEFSVELSGLGEGMHTLNISGKDADGDSFRVSKVFKVDTLPPRLLLSSPINGSTFSPQGTLEISGITDDDARFTIVVDGETKVSRRSISELNGSINPDGVFSFNINVDPGVSSHRIAITVSDKSGNRFTREAVVMNSGLSKINNLSVFVDGVQYTNRNIKLDSSGSTTAQLSLVAETENSSFVINDYELVSWSVHTVKGSASVSDNGMLIVAKDSIGYVTGEFKVAENASMTASATFGADVYSKPLSEYHTLTLGASIGGRVSGSGSYAKGTEVAITAEPSSGYEFVRWRVLGDVSVEIADPASSQTTVIMPDSDVSIVAEFEYIDETDEDEEDEEDEEPEAPTGDEEDEEHEEPEVPTGEEEVQELVTLTLDAGEYGTVYGSGSYETGTEVNISAVPAEGYKFKGWKVSGDVQVTIANPESAQTTVIIPDRDITIIAEFEYVKTGEVPEDTNIIKAGEKSYIPLEAGMNKNRMVVCTLVDGVEQIVQMCAVSDGNMYFIAPVDGVYYLKEIDVLFSDISGHWAKEYIESATVKNLFKGISVKLFYPDGYMTRAMFVTVLGRLRGINVDEYQGSSFNDVVPGEWYSPYVEWAAQNGIIHGYGNGYFGTNDEITREQMCVMLERYVKFAKYDLPEVNEVTIFADHDNISSWAKASVYYAQRTGLVIGMGNNLFNPLCKATRAEVATIFDRLILRIIDSLK